MFFNIMLLVIFLLLCALFIKWLFIKLISPIRTGGSAKAVTVEKQKEYKKKATVMNDSEMALFHALIGGLSDKYFVFPKMRIADILDIVDGSGYYKRRNDILPKHIDFLICDEWMKPLLAIELDGSSHNKLSRITQDVLKNDVFQDAGLPLQRIKVGGNFKHIVSELRENLKTV
jgi:hypothetical protein